MTPLREAARRALHEWKTDPGSVRMASLMMALQDALAYHKETDDLELAMMQGMDKGRELEREACARVCEVHGSMAKHAVWMAEECAALIRARGAYEAETL